MVSGSEASRRLDVVYGVLLSVRGSGGIEEVASEDGIVYDWFLPGHVNRFARLLGEIMDRGREGRFWIVRAGSYIVVAPNPRAPPVRGEIRRFLSWVGMLLDDVFSDELSRVGYSEVRLESVFYEGLDSDHFAPSWLTRRVIAGVTLFYSALGGSLAGFRLPPSAAVIGVDSDTGRLFVRILPPASTAALALVAREVLKGDEDAVRALMGYDSEAWSAAMQGDEVVRLQGDLYVRFIESEPITGFIEPAVLARRLTTAWTAALQVYVGLDDLLMEAYQRYARILEGYGSDRSRITRLKAAAKGLEQAIVNLHPWSRPSSGSDDALDDEWARHDCGIECIEVGLVLAGLQRRISPYTNPLLAQFAASEEIEVFRPPRRDRREEPLNPESSRGDSDTWIDLGPGPHPLEVFKDAGTAAYAITLWNTLASLPEEALSGIIEKASARSAAALALVAANSKLPGPHPLVTGNIISNTIHATLIEALAIAAQRAIERGVKVETLNRLEEVARQASKLSLIEAEIGNHRVTLEGYHVGEPAVHGVTLMEAVIDLKNLWIAVMKQRDLDRRRRHSMRRSLLSMLDDQNEKTRLYRLNAAKALSRLIAHKTEELVVVTPKNGTTIEAVHLEHGRATIEVAEATLLTIYTNPSMWSLRIEEENGDIDV